MICAETETPNDTPRIDGEAERQQEIRQRPARLLRRDSRLRTRHQLSYVRTRGLSRSGKRCVVCAVEPCDGRARLAITVSRRYSRKAVSRNRARRLLREAYRRLFPELKPAWIVLLPRRHMQGARLDDVLPELRRLFCDLRLLRTEERNH